MCDGCFCITIVTWLCGTGCIIKKGLKDEKAEMEKQYHSKGVSIRPYPVDDR